jgi:HEPN domain-containing protein
MQHDERAEEVAAWLSRAGQDLRAAEVDLRAEPPLLADSVFHCQQAVEKSLKAFLTHCDHPFRKTHDIGELATACLKHEPSLEPVLRESVPFTEYVWRFRYPGNLFEPEQAEAQGALDVAVQVVDAVATAIAE